jgi:hypothetical protein
MVNTLLKSPCPPEPPLHGQDLQLSHSWSKWLETATLGGESEYLHDRLCSSIIEAAEAGNPFPLAFLLRRLAGESAQEDIPSATLASKAKDALLDNPADVLPLLSSVSVESPAQRKGRTMKKRFTEAQIVGFLREADAGIPVTDLCRTHGFSDASDYSGGARSAA